MNIEKLEFFAELGSYSRWISLHARAISANDSYGIAQPVNFRVVLPGEEDTQELVPMLRMRMSSALQLMDELWRCGLRPSEGSGSAGSLAATERHLKDMQAISTRLLDRVLQPMPLLNTQAFDASDIVRPDSFVEVRR